MTWTCSAKNRICAISGISVISAAAAAAIEARAASLKDSGGGGIRSAGTGSDILGFALSLFGGAPDEGAVEQDQALP
jgi:hypothetical protein